MRYFLKRYPDGGWEYSPVGRSGEPREGYEIVETIPQDIRDREPGGKDFVIQADPRDAKLADLEARVLKLEGKTA
jgi:hypothetical protein